MKGNFTIRPALISDIKDLVRLRRIMFEAMGFKDPKRLDLSDEASASYFTQAIPKRQFFGWLAVTPAGDTVGSGGIVIDQHPPGPDNLTGKIGYIMNLVVIPQYRRLGIARKLMLTMLDWLKKNKTDFKPISEDKDINLMSLGYEKS